MIGRTDWDEACTKEINPKVQYHFCNESLRDSFYSGSWEYQNCEKHSIFMSQAATPIKGLHFYAQSNAGNIEKLSGRAFVCCWK